MTRRTQKILFSVTAAASAALFAPGAGYADIVFDPVNFVQAVEQVAQDIQLVEQFHQQIQNQLALLKGWGFTELGGILQSMEVWQGVLGRPDGGYTTIDPGTPLNRDYPPDPSAFTGASDGSMESMQTRWDRESRRLLIENRTIQNDTVLNLAPTAERIGRYVEHSNAASGVTAAMQAGNEELATLVAQLQGLQAQELTEARGEVEKEARAQAEEAYAEAQCQAVRAGWNHPPPPTSSLAEAFPLARR